MRIVRASVGQRTRDRLAYPPGRIGRELKAPAVVKLLGRAYEAEGALLNQVEERQSLVAVVLGDRDHQAQVGLDHLPLGVDVAALDPSGQVDLLLGAEQPDLADLFEEQLQRIGRHVGLQVERGPGLAAPALIRRALHLIGERRGRVDVLDQLDLRSLEEPVQLLDVGLVDVEPGRGRRDLSVREHTDPLALGNQALYLFEFLQLDY